jgi:hypothetical protein
MCSINHEKKCIFIHTPKNGGTYISSILSKYYGFTNYYLQRPDHKRFCLGKDRSVDKHENKIHGTLVYYKTSSHLNNIMNMNAKKWNTYFIFTFLRNPFDRIVSGWNYVNRYNISFKKYLNINQNANSYDYWHVFMTQSRHIIDTNGKINIHFYGFMNNLENDLKTLLYTIGFRNILHEPSYKNSKYHKDYRIYYEDDEIKKKVEIIMEEDFRNFTKEWKL